MEQRSPKIFEKINEQFAELSSRDRKLLVGLMSFMLVVGVSLLWWTLSGKLSEQGSRVIESKQTLQELQMLQAEYLALSSLIEAREADLAETENQPLSAFVENIAAENGLSESLRAVNELTTSEAGGLSQIRYKVEFKRAPLDLLLGLIYDMETSSYPLRVEMTQLKTMKTSEGKMIDAHLELVVFNLREDAS